jgi:alpha-L-arabinofuranosidase
MIRFSSSRVMGTPSYYVQALMAQNVGTQVVPVTMENPYKATYLAQNMTPKKSLSGVATWGTKATFSTNGGKFKPRTGQWTNNNDGTISQKSLDQQCIAIDTQNVIDSDHYTINYRARKDSGDEGFIIVFNYVDDNNYCWLNLGGWGNSQHAIEQAVNGGKMQTAMKAGSVETGRWYNVRLNVEGDHVKCWLDDELIFDTQLKHDTAADVFASATIDEANNELIVKIVNSLNTPTTATLDLKNFRAREARVIRLQANGGMDENTLENPTNIHPVETSLSPNENNVLVDIPANSLNIVRIK